VRARCEYNGTVVDRTERLNVRIAPEEMAMLEELAERAGVSASDIVRTLIRQEHADFSRENSKGKGKR
jgi:uncharacterized protein (DUF1778 family)